MSNGAALLKAILEKVASDPWEAGARGMDGEMFTEAQVEWALEQVKDGRFNESDVLCPLCGQ